MPARRTAEDTTKQRLVQAARDLLLTGGLPSVSMRRVGSACGLSATAIYRHFEDKDALLAAAVLQGFRTFGSYLLSALEKRTPQARLRHLMRRYFDFSAEHPQDYRLIFMTDCDQLALPNLDEAARQEISGTFQMLQDRIVECQVTGCCRNGDPRSLAAFVWASLHGLAALMVSGNLGVTARERDKLVEQHIELAERALSPAKHSN